ncbi:MAG: NAD-dependent epimerase/dehydratase family protein, partial [Rhodospirillaceae bacterium]|nr:NAD-dependent epimerase/dehydratase family protein [Rhodospirillaceae bacterium]
MIAEIGQYVLIAALVLAAIQAVVPLWGAARGEAGLMAVGDRTAIAQAAALLIAFAALTHGFVTSDFSLQIVFQNSHSLKPMLYKVSGVWGNHEGSMLLWVLVLALFSAAVAVFGRNLPPTLKARVLSIQAMIGFAFIALRYHMTLGPGNVTSPGMAKVIQDITGAMDGEPVTIAEVGGDLRRQLTYVRDSAAATVLALTHPSPSFRLYNVAGPDENYVRLNELYEAMRQVAPECGTVTFTGRGREAGSVDITRIRQDLGFEPQFGIAEGLRAQREDR